MLPRLAWRLQDWETEDLVKCTHYNRSEYDLYGNSKGESEELRLKVVSVVVVAREHHLWLDWIYASPKVTKDQKRITLAFSSLI